MDPAPPTGPPAAAPSLRRPSRLRLLLRLAVSLGLLGILIAKAPSFDDLLPPGHRGAAIAFLVATFAMAFVSLLLQAWRWQRVVAVLGDDVRFGVLVRHTLVGQFVGNVLPTTIGGDVVRVTRLGTTTGSHERAFASVALERLTGWVALPTITAIGFLAQPSLVHERHAWIALAIAGGTLLLLVAILVLAAHPRALGRFAGHENWLRFLGAVHTGTDRLRRDPARVAGVFVAALAYQVSVVLTVALAMRVVDLHLSAAEIAAFVPAVAMAQVLLPTLNGLGAREGFLVLFLVPVGATSPQAITVGLIWYASGLVASLPGAPVFAAGHRHRTTGSSAGSATGVPAEPPDAGAGAPGGAPAHDA